MYVDVGICSQISLTQMDTEYYVYSDREWCEIQKNEYIHVLDIPYPRYNVWHCEKCGRITLFDDSYNLVKVYKPEE